MIDALKRICLSLVFAFAVLTGTFAVGALVTAPTAADETDASLRLKTVRVGYLLYPGYQEGKGDEPKSGYGYEYLQQIAYFAGWQYEYVNGNFSELLQMLKDGRIDLMGNLSYTPERAKSIDFARDEQGREYYYLFVRDDRGDIMADIRALEGAVVGVNKGSVQADIFRDWCKANGLDVHIRLYDNSADRHRDMNSGVLDATVSTNVAARDITRFHWVATQKLGSSPYYFATSKKRPDLLEDLNKANARIHQSDWYFNEKVYLKYYGKTSASSAGLTRKDLEWLKGKQGIRVGFVNGTMPYCDTDPKTDRLIGLLAYFVDFMKSRYDADFKTKPYPDFDAAVQALYRGEVDTIFPAYGSFWVAEKHGMMVTDSLTSSHVLMLTPSSAESPDASVIAVAEPSPAQRFYVEELFPKSKALYFRTPNECIRAVLDGRATATMMSSDVYYANRNAYEQLSSLNIINTGYPTLVSFAVMKGNVDLYGFMKKSVASITDDDVHEALIASRHVNNEQTLKQFVQKNVELVLGIFALIIALLIAYLISLRKALGLVRRNSELNKKAYIDLATGLPNKNSCEEMLSSPLPPHEPTAVFMLDLNDLKIVNDTLGHEMGDLMILSFAKRLRQSVPSRFFVGRYGGDEFIVIAKNMTDPSAAEDLVTTLENIVLQFNSVNGRFKLSYACGFAFSKEFPTYSLTQLLEVADQRMYVHKGTVKAHTAATADEY